MANLFWKTKHDTKNLLETPFKTEEEFEIAVFETPEILGDIFLIKRQIRGSNKPGVPDIIGIDNDGNVCIVEMKNVRVDASIIPQVLQYAIWAETNPDSVKSLWLECENRPDDLSISWDSFQVRIIVIAPNILRSTLDFVDRITYPVDLIEVTRWIEGEDHVFLVNVLELEKKIRTKPVRGLEVYDKDFYETEYNRESAKEFMRYVGEVEKIIKEKEWSLERKFNKQYCGFKAGNFNAFAIEWKGTKTFAFIFKLDQAEAESVPIPMTKYDTGWKQANYYIKPGETKTRDFLPLFEMSYRRLTGE